MVDMNLMFLPLLPRAVDELRVSISLLSNGILIYRIFASAESSLKG